MAKDFADAHGLGMSLDPDADSATRRERSRNEEHFHSEVENPGRHDDKSKTADRRITCGQACATSNHLTVHLRVHSASPSPAAHAARPSHGPAPFRGTCDACGEAFAESGDFTRYLRVHSGDKLFSCLTCRKAFAESDHLTRHCGVHSCKLSKNFCSKYSNSTTQHESFDVCQWNSMRNKYCLALCKKPKKLATRLLQK